METAPDIHAERVRAAVANTPLAALVNAANGTIVAVCMLVVRDDQRALPWLAAVLLVAALRAWSWQRHRYGVPGRWSGVLGATAAGTLWGGGAAWFMPVGDSLQVLWIFVIGGMCAGAASLNYAHLPMVFGFVLPASLPVIVRSLREGSPQDVAEAAMMLVFVASIFLTAHRASRQFDTMVRLRLDLAARARETAVLHDQLRAEIASHRATAANLRHLQKMEALGQITGGIAHDFNNLLMAVLGSLKLLRKRLTPGDAQATRLLENALAGAERGASLTQRLLAFGRRRPQTEELVELARLVPSMAELLRNALGGAMRVQMPFPPGLPPVRVDANQLELALLNLALNARDAMPRGGTLTITGQDATLHAGQGPLPEGRYVVLSVADTGEGMDETTLARATEPFFTTKEAGKGTGLGLAMVQGLAAEAGGQLILRSRLGVGTVAELWLPAALPSHPPPRAPPTAAPSPLPGPSRRVLVVDDDPLVLASTMAMLDDLGHQPLEATSGQEALDLLRSGRAVDLVITDYGMPGMTGVQLADALQRLRPDLPVLLATGYAEVPGDSQPGAATADLPRLLKPFGPETLAEAIAAPFRVAGSGR